MEVNAVRCRLCKRLHCDQRRTRQALEERDFGRANDVDHQRLGQKRFHELSGLEQRRIVQALNA
jgi:hypothetical protein